jgi:hypothetical protein
MNFTVHLNEKKLNDDLIFNFCPRNEVCWFFFWHIRVFKFFN